MTDNTNDKKPMLGEHPDFVKAMADAAKADVFGFGAEMGVPSKSTAPEWLTERQRGRRAIETLEVVRDILAVEGEGTIAHCIDLIDYVTKPGTALLRLSRTTPDSPSDFVASGILMSDTLESMLGAATIMGLSLEEVEWALHECGEVSTDEWTLDYVPPREAQENPMANPNKGTPKWVTVWKARWDRVDNGEFFEQGEFDSAEEAWSVVRGFIADELERVALNPEASGIQQRDQAKEIVHGGELWRATYAFNGTGVMFWVNLRFSVTSYEVQD